MPTLSFPPFYCNQLKYVNEIAGNILGRLLNLRYTSKCDFIFHLKQHKM